VETLVRGVNETQYSPVPTALDNGRRSARKLLTRRRRSAARAEAVNGAYEALVRWARAA